MILKQLELGPMGNFTYILGDEGTKKCAVIDPGWDKKGIMKEVEALGLAVTKILLTHSHFDHANAAGPLSDETGARVYVHELEAAEVKCKEKATFSDGEKIKIGGIELECIHTPGHTAGSTCFLVDKTLFTGDTLFVDAIGRTDLDSSDPEDMFASLVRLSRLPEGTVIYAGHNYGSEPVSTIGEQKKRNPYMKFRSVDDFLRS